jgi:hypothetical protein
MDLRLNRRVLHCRGRSAGLDADIRARAGAILDNDGSKPRQANAIDEKKDVRRCDVTTVVQKHIDAAEADGRWDAAHAPSGGRRRTGAAGLTRRDRSARTTRWVAPRRALRDVPDASDGKG